MENLITKPGIDLIIGPMYASKSTELVRRLNIYYELDMKVLYINSTKDERSTCDFSTHNQTIKEIPFNTTKVAKLENIDVSAYNVIGIDEAQLFSNLKRTVLHWVEDLGKIVLVCGLNGDFRREPFGEIMDLIPLCDSIVKLTPFCISCKKDHGIVRKAHFSKRIVDNDQIILIGAKESYIPVCRQCYTS